MKRNTRYLCYASLLVIPLLVPLLAGSHWLWRNQLLAWWIGISALLGLICWLLSLIMKRLYPEPEWLDLRPHIIWTPQSTLAWQQVENLAQRLRETPAELDSSAFYLQTLTDVMDKVAKVYYPQQDQALLQVRVPDLLQAIERFAHDLRERFTASVPGGTLFSINDLTRTHRLTRQGQALYRLFRIVSAGLDPVSATVRELKMLTTAHLLTGSSHDIKRWLIDAYVKKIGYYAIQLYSGHLALDEQAFQRPTRQTRDTLRKIHSNS